MGFAQQQRSLLPVACLLARCCLLVYNQMNAAFIICLCVPFTAGCQVTPTGMQHARTYAYVVAGRDEMRRSWIPGTRNQTGANHIRHCNVNEANEAHTHREWGEATKQESIGINMGSDWRTRPGNPHTQRGWREMSWDEKRRDGARRGRSGCYWVQKSLQFSCIQSVCKSSSSSLQCLW